MPQHDEESGESLVSKFNEHINRRAVDGLASLMSDDHTFIDTAGGRVVGKQACLAAWRGFFDTYPDYRNHFDAIVSRGDVVAVVGRLTCAEPSLAGPAVWTARVRGGEVVEWRVYEDSPAIRRQLRLA